MNNNKNSDSSGRFIYPQYKDQVTSTAVNGTSFAVVGGDGAGMTDGRGGDTGHHPAMAVLPPPPPSMIMVAAEPVPSPNDQPRRRQDEDRSGFVDDPEEGHGNHNNNGRHSPGASGRRRKSGHVSVWKGRFVGSVLLAIFAVMGTAAVVFLVTRSVGGNTSNSSAGTTVPLETTQELYDAVDRYLAGDVTSTLRYGTTMAAWDVSRIRIFDRLFSTDRNSVVAYFSPARDELILWDTSSAESMVSMFSGAGLFNGDLSRWNLAKVRDMSFMFNHSYSFEGFGVSSWDVSSVENMEHMFFYAHAFTGDVSPWEVSRVKILDGMFDSVYQFDCDISNWDVSSTVDMDHMFANAASFNTDISRWNVQSVTTMSQLFQGASSFNQDLSMWPVTSLINADHMFTDASAFNQNLCPWQAILPTTVTRNETFTGTACPDPTEAAFCHLCERR
jgi:surface protein